MNLVWVIDRLRGKMDEIRLLPTSESHFLWLRRKRQVAELDGSPFDSYKANGKRHALSSLKTLIPVEPRNFC